MASTLSSYVSRQPNLSILSAGVMLAFGVLAGATELPSAPRLITLVAQMAQPLQSKTREVFQAKMTGVVYGVDRPHSSLIFADGGGWVWLETENIPETVGSGARVTVQGTIDIGNGHAFLGKTAIVEGERYRDWTEQSGRVYLGAGKHNLELVYHQGTQRALLSVEYEGPGIPRGPIPGSALWHADTNVPAQFLAGLKCEIYRGIMVEKPDLKSLTPDFSDLVGAFTCRFVGAPNGRNASGTRVNYVLRYRGSLQIGQPGVYQFYVTANDGATLALDYDSQCRFDVLGHTNLAAPVLLTPAQMWGNMAEPLWAQFEGRVVQVGGINGQLQLGLEGDSGTMSVMVSDGDIRASAMLLNSYVRVNGLASGVIGMHGKKNAGELLVPSMNQIAILRAAEGNWQTHAGLPAWDVAGKSTGLDPNPVEIHGTVVNVEPRKSITIQDGSGQIQVRTSLADLRDMGTGVEALGEPWRTDQGTLLFYAVYRTLPQTNASQPLPLLTSIEQIRRLKDKDLGIPYPFKFKGTMIGVVSGGLAGTVRGESEAITISTTNDQPAVLHLGDLCEFEGALRWRQNRAEAYYARFTLIGRGKFPDPQHPTWTELMNGNVQSQWVEIQGIVTEISPRAGSLTVRMPGGDIQIHLAQFNADIWLRCLHSVVQVRGIANNFISKNNQVTGALIEVNSQADVTVIRSGPQNIFHLPERRVADVLAFDPDASTYPLIKVSGQIMFIRDSTYYLWDGTNGLHFTTTKSDKWAVGDVVQVVGLPENDRLSPSLRNSAINRLRHDPLPPPVLVQPKNLNSEQYESALIQMDTKLLGVSTNLIEQFLELQLSPSHTAIARLDSRRGTFPNLLPQSRVRVTGVFSSRNKTSEGPAEILLNSPSDVLVLETPPWWNVQRSLTLLGAVTLALFGSVTWITTLRRRVDLRTRELGEEINEHKITEANLHENTAMLQNEIEERKRIQLEVETIHRQLIEASRQAGQADIAANILHNVGNVLNSVNVSTTVITNRTRNLHFGNIAKVADLLEQHAADFVANHEKGRQVPQFLRQISLHLAGEQEGLLTELRDLGQNVEHIKEIIAAQQTYAKRLGILEACSVSEIVESALKVHAAAYARHSIHIIRNYEAISKATLDKHKVLQILVNFFQNSINACEDGGQKEKTITVCLQNCPPDEFRIKVADNGIGIAPENLPRIFTHGFTTRQNGHGFGLHSAALAAKELGGTVVVHSDGLGTGATFTLQLPLQPPSDTTLYQRKKNSVTTDDRSPANVLM